LDADTAATVSVGADEPVKKQLTTKKPSKFPLESRLNFDGFITAPYSVPDFSIQRLQDYYPLCMLAVKRVVGHMGGVHSNAVGKRGYI
jgi:hypothetical protein